MYRIEGFVSRFVNRYSDRVTEEFVSVVCESMERAKELLQQFKSKYVDVDLAIRPVAAARQSRRVRVEL